MKYRRKCKKRNFEQKPTFNKGDI